MLYVYLILFFGLACGMWELLEQLYEESPSDIPGTDSDGSAVG